MTANSIFKVEISHPDLEPIEPVLLKWLNLVERYSVAFSNNDACYWHSERANIGVLAAAAWGVGEDWVAVEEFPTTKRGENGTEKNGRCDLYIANGDHEVSFGIEAKQAWQGSSVSQVEFFGAVKTKMGQAWNDAGALQRTEASQRVACCFIIPRFHRNHLENNEIFEIRLKKWVEAIKNANIKHDGFAYMFPKESRGLLNNENYIFPGVCMLLRVRKRGNS
jgi:hypothetical protein